MNFIVNFIGLEYSSLGPGLAYLYGTFGYTVGKLVGQYSNSDRGVIRGRVYPKKPEDLTSRGYSRSARRRNQSQAEEGRLTRHPRAAGEVRLISQEPLQRQGPEKRGGGS